MSRPVERFVDLLAVAASVATVGLYGLYLVVDRPWGIPFAFFSIVVFTITYAVLAGFQFAIARVYDVPFWQRPIRFRWVMVFKFGGFAVLLAWVIATWLWPALHIPWLTRLIWALVTLDFIWFLRRSVRVERPGSADDFALNRVPSAAALITSLAEALPAVVADASGTIRHTTAAFNDLIGAAPGELTGQNLVVLMPERYRARHLAGLARYLATGESRIIGTMVAVDLLCRDGGELPIYLALTTTDIADEPWFVGTVWRRNGNGGTA